VLTKDLYRAGFEKPMIGFASGITPQLVSAAGKQVTEGLYTLLPVPATGSAAFARVQKMTGKTQLDTYACQSYDHANLFVLAVVKAMAANGTAIRNNLRVVSNGPGEVVSDAVTGLKLLAQGKTVDYDGASGPCAFEANGNISDCNFQLQQIKDGQFVNTAS
jgi:branched-chain amino acid transport system substrate-binding protein